MPEPLDLEIDLLSGGREEESLFARDDNDVLIRREKETRERFKEMVTITLDGVSLTLPRAVPTRDAQGNVRNGPDGLPIPRTTTIYDAALELVRQGHWSREELNQRIPILCHQEHMTPVAVCRMCSVHISSIKRGKLTPARKLVPACQHRIEKDMVVTTRGGGETGKETERFAKQVDGSVRLLSELLIGEHLHPDARRDDRYRNELGIVAETLEVKKARSSFQTCPKSNRNAQVHVKSRPISLPVVARASDVTDMEEFPYSARSIVVDHNRCILCDRCVRACSEVKPFQVIGHTGKGYRTHISFDLDQIMNESSCVQCGECMTSCPTGALTFRRRVSPKVWPDLPAIPTDPTQPLPPKHGFLTAEEMYEIRLSFRNSGGETHNFYPFRSIPLAYLKWNEGAVRRREVQPGELLCSENEYGRTAFFLESGVFEIRSQGGRTTKLVGPKSSMFGLGKASPSAYGNLLATVDHQALILGELACLSSKPRTASILVAQPGVVYEVTRNVLDMVQRSRSARKPLAEVYQRNAISTSLLRGKLLDGLPVSEHGKVVQFLVKPREQGQQVRFRRVEPGEVILAQGDYATDFYVIRRGFVKITTNLGGAERVLAHLSDGQFFGEVSLLCDDPVVSVALPQDYQDRRRTASVSALDEVELVRIPRHIFYEMCDQFPQVKKALVEHSLRLMQGNQRPLPLVEDRMSDFVQQGLFQGQNLLVLDLESCTRCDECTKACADAHDGNSRLLREGLRFGSFLVATSCRSCHKPYCMDGCPVDAIHRKNDHLEVVIEDHCIGCGLCERNCPYGAIQLVPKHQEDMERGMIAAVPKRAVNCDLCNGGKPFCVHACPHDAAHRISGNTLRERVASK